jgi:hypothetical protein
MGLIQHHAVVATTWDSVEFAKVHDWVQSLPADEHKYFMFGPGMTNGYRTVVCLPDGSKEGWIESNKGDERRRAFIHALGGAYCWYWVEVTFGEVGYSIVQGEEGD